LKKKKDKFKVKQQKFKLPLEIVFLGEEGCHLFCNGRVGSKKVRILIDTGASKSVLAAAFVDKMKKPNFIEMIDNQTAGIGKDQVEARFIRLKKMKLGKLEIKNHIVGTIDVSHVKQVYDSIGVKPFDLILGGDILEERRAEINYKKSELILFG
jgi:hypothetical protein